MHQQQLFCICCSIIIINFVPVPWPGAEIIGGDRVTDTKLTQYTGELNFLTQISINPATRFPLHERDSPLMQNKIIEETYLKQN